MTRFPKTVWAFLKNVHAEWTEDKAHQLAAALAYYTAFSLAPLLVIAIAVTGQVFGEEAVRGEIVRQFRGLVGESGAKVIQEMVLSAGRDRSGLIASAIGLATLIFGASNMFYQLKDTLNNIWDVTPQVESGVWEIIKNRFLSVLMVIGTCFLLLVSLVVDATISAASGYFSHWLPGFDTIWIGVNFTVGFGISTLIFALIFKYVPDAEISWRDVWIGALATALLFSVGRFLIGFYLGRGAVTSTYGAAGSFVVVLVWIYFSSQILFLGAEFTQVYARRYGSRIRKSDDDDAGAGGR